VLRLRLLLTVNGQRRLCQTPTAHVVQIESHESYESHESHMATVMKKLIIISCTKVLIDGNASNVRLSRVFVDNNYSVDQDDIITFMWERGAL
jgi:predicted secreted protein